MQATASSATKENARHCTGTTTRPSFRSPPPTTDSVGRVIDFAELKSRLKGWIDEHWDHGFILWDRDTAAIAAMLTVEPNKLFLLPTNPTAENLAKFLLEQVCPELLSPLGVTAERVILWETQDAYAAASHGV